MTITERIDAITLIPEDYRSATPPIPKSVKIELTARCDFNCFFCASGKRLRDKNDMPWEMFTRLADEMVEAGVKELGMFYLGESFLYPALPEAIKYAKDIGFEYVFLTTNGRMATPFNLGACFEAGLDSLKFSFNNADGEQLAEVAGIKAKTFDVIVKNMEEARQIRDLGGYKCGLYASSIHYDGDQHEKMQAAVDKILPFVDEHYWLPLYGQADLTSGENDTAPVAGNPGRLDNMRPPLPCWAVFTEGHITYDGHLSACCFDHDGRFNMGDLKEMSFSDAWHSQKFQDLRTANLACDVTGTACEQCIAYE